jgi:hypothetical protein
MGLSCLFHLRILVPLPGIEVELKSEILFRTLAPQKAIDSISLLDDAVEIAGGRILRVIWLAHFFRLIGLTQRSIHLRRCKKTI